MSIFHGPRGDFLVEQWGEARYEAYRVLRSGAELDWASVPRALEEHADLRALLTEVLRQGPEAFFWECAPWRAEGRSTFQFVLPPAPALSRTTARPDAFEAHFDGAPVATFDSLRGDARLVVPQPAGRPDAYGHLATFVRAAPEAQVDALWIAVADALRAWRRAKRGTVWLSTSGLGVPWLHVRLDSRPKYYTHADYRRG